MITSATFKNFRGFTDLTIPLSRATMLTGANGTGKTSVLEGLFCLFSETRLDVSSLRRYSKSIGIKVNLAANMPVGAAAHHNYNYRLFWEECPSYERSECSVNAKGEDGISWSWQYQKAYFSDLDAQITKNSPIPVDSSTEFAKWTWRKTGKVHNKKNHQPQTINEKFVRAQTLVPDGRLILLPGERKNESICRYFDFLSLRLKPDKLSFDVSKQITKALQIINPRVTDVRLTDTESGLSVVLDDSRAVTLGSIGNGAATWVSTLLALFDVVNAAKNLVPKTIPVFVLIDEIGAGIHYSAMRDIWKYMKEFCENHPAMQFVFTSHSDDCIRAYCEAFSAGGMARIVRLHKNTGGEIIPTDYLEDKFGNIIDGDWEVRG